VGGIFWEHGHRLIASTVGFLILVLAFWLWRAEPRRWVRRLGLVALAAVIAQGILGGITVLWFLPKPVSIAHAGLAQIVFCITVSIALVTSRGWQRGYTDLNGSSTVVDDRTLQRLALATTMAVYVQILLGATMRHTGAGLAIPDFPLAFGALIPPQWDARIGVHFAHRVGAAIVAVMVLATAIRMVARARGRRELMRPSMLLLVLLCVQVTLGAFVVWSGKHFVINSVHVATGASILGTCVVLTLRAHRSRFGLAAAAQARVAA